MKLKSYSEFLNSLSEDDVKFIMGTEDEYNDLLNKLKHSGNDVKAC